jgi:CRISPR-associated DxTHG motif protein
MNKILISILGKGQSNKELKKSDYQLTKYQIENSEPIESKLVSDILIKEIGFDKVYVVGTDESLWNVANDFIGEENYQKVTIPYGKNDSEFWKIFEVLTQLDVDNKDIYFDITHGFRSIPIFVSTLLNFFSKVKNAKVKGVYYGIFEARNNDITPVVNMLPFLEMNQFIDAFSIFKKYSDGRDIASIINEKFKEIPSHEKRKYGKIRELSKELEFYSKAIGFSAVELYHNSLSKIERKIEDIDEIPNNLKAIEFLISDMKNELNIYRELDKEWDRDLKTAELLYDKNRYAQSLTILRETVLTYILEELVLDSRDKDLREQKLGKLFKEDSNRLQKEEETIYFTKELIPLLESIRELRNKSNHAFLSKNVGTKDINNSVENLEKFLIKLRELCEFDEVIKDRNKLKEKLEFNE